ncbi:hypothetical protein Q5A_016505 [Serratia inhibens PRI-2C]|nr:hypothetical protein Q5A_016505 [Serratia inhibens PRI-2C]
MKKRFPAYRPSSSFVRLKLVFLPASCAIYMRHVLHLAQKVWWHKGFHVSLLKLLEEEKAFTKKPNNQLDIPILPTSPPL